MSKRESSRTVCRYARRAIIPMVAGLAAALAGASPAAAANWGQFGGSAAHTGFGADTAISLANVGSLSESCRGASGAIGSPAIVSSRVYSHTADGGVVAMDADTCAIVWSRQIGSGASYSSPAVGDGLVYVAAYDLELGPLTGTLSALDAATGDLRWTAQLPGPGVPSPPSVAGGRVAIGSPTGTVLVLDAATGVTLWSRAVSSTANWGYRTTTAIARGVVYVSTMATVKAFQASSGKQLWTRPLRGHGEPPVVADGRVYVRARDSGGALHALDAVTGNVLWRRSVEDEYLRPPVAAYGRLYTSGNYRAYALEAGTGQFLWTTDLPGGSTEPYGGSNDTERGPVVANRVVYLPSPANSTLHALNATTGTLVWAGDLGAPTRSPVAVANGSLYATVTDSSGGLRRLSPP